MKTLTWLVLLGALGIWTGTMSFRGLARKPCTHDEAFTLLWVSGHSWKEVSQAFARKRITAGDVASLERSRANEEPSLSIAVFRITKNFLHEDQIHPPGYFSLVWGWQRIFGDGLRSARELSAVFRIMNPGLLGWLTFEVYGSTLAGFITALLFLVNPLHMNLGITARDYPAFTAFFALASIAFLVWRRKRTRFSLLMYALSLCVSTLFSFLSLMFMAAHLAFLCLDETIQRGKMIRTWLQAALLPLLFVALSLVFGFAGGNSGKASNLGLVVDHRSFGYLLLSVGKNVVQIFFDLNDVSRFSHPAAAMAVVVVIALIFVALFSSLRESQRNWRLLLYFALANFAPLFLLDAVMTRTFYTTDRHLVIAHSVLIILVARQIQLWISSREPRIWQVGWYALVLVLALGALSCEVITRSPDWQPRTTSYSNRAIIETLNSAAHPVLFAHPLGTDFGNLLAMSNNLKPDTELIVSDMNFSGQDFREDVASHEWFFLKPSDGEMAMLKSADFQFVEMPTGGRFLFALKK